MKGMDEDDIAKILDNNTLTWSDVLEYMSHDIFAVAFMHLTKGYSQELRSWLWKKLEVLDEPCPECGYASLNLDGRPRETWDTIWNYHLWKERRERLQTINPFCHHDIEEEYDE